MELQRLKAFDSRMITYSARLKEIWVSEKYRRGKYFVKDSAGRHEIYSGLARQVKVQITDLENTEFNDSELLDCREHFLHAGRALVRGYEKMRTSDEAANDFNEFSYFLDNARSELNRLWQEYDGKK